MICLSLNDPFCIDGRILKLLYFLEVKSLFVREAGAEVRLHSLFSVSSPGASVYGPATKPCQGKPHSLFSYRKTGQGKGRGRETSFSLLLLPRGFKSLTALSGSCHVLHRNDVRWRTYLCCVIIALFSARGSRRLKEPLCLENHVFGSSGSYLC